MSAKAKRSNGAIEVERGIAMPVRAGSANQKYPLAELQIGDSFLLPVGTLRENVSGSISYAAMKLGRKFITRTVEGGRVRVWRVS